MSNSYYIRFDGKNLHPDTMDVSDLATILDSMSRLVCAIAPNEEEVKFSLHSIEDNCIKLNFNCLTAPALSGLLAFMTACSNGNINSIPLKAANPIQKLNAQINKYEMEMELGTPDVTIPVKFNPEKLIPSPNIEFSEYQTSVYGQIVSVGGNDPNVHISPLGGREQVICNISQEVAKELGAKLYQQIGIEGIVLEEKDGRPHRMRLVRILNFNPADGKSMLTKISDLNFDDAFTYDSVDAFMKDIRGETEDGKK